MDKEDLKSILISRNIDLWHMIDTAIDVAASDHSSELRLRRDGFVQKLYAKKFQTFKESKPIVREKLRSSSDYEERKNFVLEIKELLNDPNQPSESLNQLLRKLVDVDMTLKALEETGIGRNVNVLRKHASIEVQKTAKQLIKNWRAVVDVSVKNNSKDNNLMPITTVENSPQMIQAKNDIKNVHQAPLESTFSPHIQSCVTSSQLSNSETLGNPSAFLTSVKKNEQNYSLSEEQTIENARKRLCEDYQAAENGANRYYYMCVKDLLAFGGGGGFALSLEEDLLLGTSGRCETFGNTCLAHSSSLK